MRRLRDKLPEWGYRYKVPWYVLIGESGSGKTSIANALSGMSAEIVEPGPGEYAPRWLLLQEAVLIDLPGRAFLSTEPLQPRRHPRFLHFWTKTRPRREGAYLPDRNAWSSFLRLTARYRPRQPLNGVDSDHSGDRIARNQQRSGAPSPPRPYRRLAKRLDEIQHLTGLSVPVYVLVTKCDAVNGFASYSRSFFRESILNRSGT